MLEPYVKSQIFDQSASVASTPADTGFEIAAAVFTPTGPLGKKTISGQSEFISKYLTGSTVLPSDNMTISYIYSLLAYNKVTVIRACPISYLEGISCLGEVLLFDKNYKLLPSYYRAKFNSIADSLQYYYVVIGDYCFYTGTLDELPADISDDSHAIQISATKSLDLLWNNLLFKINENNLPIKIYKSSIYGLVLGEEIKSTSSNIGLVSPTIIPEGYSVLTDTPVSEESGEELELISEGQRVAFDSISYYYSGSYTVYPSGIPNAVAIETATPVSGHTTMVKNYFLMKLLAKTNKNYSGSINIGINSLDGVANNNIKFTSSTFDSNYITIDSSNNLKINGNYTPNISEGRYYSISATVANTNKVFTLGNNPTPASNEINLSNNSLTLLQFIEKLIDYILVNNSTLYVDNNPASLVVTLNNFSIPHPSTGTLVSDYFQVLEEQLNASYRVSNDSNNNDYIKYNFLWTRLGDYTFYTGTAPIGWSPVAKTTEVKMSDDSVTADEYLELLKYYTYKYHNVVEYNHSLVTSEINLEDPNQFQSIEGMNFDVSKVSQSTDAQFAVVGKFPSTTDVFRYAYERTEENKDILRIQLSYKNGVDFQEYLISFVPGTLDGYGIDRYYTAVDNEFMQIVSLWNEGDVSHQMPDEFTLDSSFGSRVPTPSFLLQYMKDAIAEFATYEDDQWFHTITDSGIANTTYAPVVQTQAEKLNSVYYASVPPDLNAKDLISFKGAAGLNSFYTFILAAGDRQPINDVSIKMPGSFKMIRDMISAYNNTSIEFAPHFGRNYGSTNVSNLIQNFSKEDREKLLDEKIMTLKGGKNGVPYYVNNNLTAQPINSNLSEEQNVRMTIQALHYMELYVKQFEAEFNDAETRRIAEEGANSLLQERLFSGRTKTPVLYKAICNENNNPLSVIEANEFVISLYAKYNKSIKYSLVKHFIVSLGATVPEN